MNKIITLIPTVLVKRSSFWGDVRPYDPDRQAAMWGTAGAGLGAGIGSIAGKIKGGDKKSIIIKTLAGLGIGGATGAAGGGITSKIRKDNAGGALQENLIQRFPRTGYLEGSEKQELGDMLETITNDQTKGDKPSRFLELFLDRFTDRRNPESPNKLTMYPDNTLRKDMGNFDLNSASELAKEVSGNKNKSDSFR